MMDRTFIEEIKQFNVNIPNSSWGATWEVRSKLITCIFTTLMIICLHSPIILGIVFCSLLVVVLSMGFRMRFVLSKFLLLLPFLLLMSGPILLAGGFPIDMHRIEFVINLNLKALSANILMIITVLSQPITKLIEGLTHLKVPRVLVTVFVVALHYTRLLFINLLTYQKALIARLFKPTSRTGSLKVYSNVIAGFVLRSVEQSDRAYQAMVSRGFTGIIPTSSPEAITWTDYIKSILFFITIFGLFIIEKWWSI